MTFRFLHNFYTGTKTGTQQRIIIVPVQKIRYKKSEAYRVLLNGYDFVLGHVEYGNDHSILYETFSILFGMSGCSLLLRKM